VGIPDHYNDHGTQILIDQPGDEAANHANMVGRSVKCLVD
tara:strand:- start:1144 stop:1263 length:120 start_codon:yes stop_codon:yes gene_type:complete